MFMAEQAMCDAGFCSAQTIFYQAYYQYLAHPIEESDFTT